MNEEWEPWLVQDKDKRECWRRKASGHVHGLKDQSKYKTKKPKKQNFEETFWFSLKTCFFGFHFVFFRLWNAKAEKTLCFFCFWWFSPTINLQKNQKNSSWFLFLHFKTKKTKNTRKTKKTSFEAKPKRLFKVLFFVFLFWGFAVIVILYILQAFRKVAIFIENSFQERDHIKQYVCNLQEFWYVVLML